ncbi:hypothetical protein EV426DRAFT_570833 [Tirmania nivea]|nr:hypothetical protein EV426DRAFT_570833 [Tirmania nivea]
MPNLLKKFHGKSKAAIKSLVRTPSSSRASPRSDSCTNLEILQTIAVSAPSVEDVTTGTTQASNVVPETSGAELAILALPAAGTLETHGPVEALLPGAAGYPRAKTMVTELTSDKIAATPIVSIVDRFLTSISDMNAQATGSNALGKTAASRVVSTTSTSTNTDGTSQIAIEKQPQTANTLSLWEEAWKKLPGDVRTHLQSTLKLDDADNKVSGVAKQLLVIVAEIRDICEKQKLINTIDDRKGSRRIIVRDLADKFISWISKFVAVGDVILGGSWYAVLRTKNFYLVPESKPRNYSNLKLVVEELYSEILEFLVETAKQHRKTLERIFKAILEPESLRELLQKIKNREKQIAEELELAQSNASQTGFADAERNHKQLMQLLDDLEKPIQRVVSDLQACYQSVQAQQREDVLNWITNNEY